MNCRLQFFSSFKEDRGKNQLLFLVASSSSFWWWKREHCCWLMGRSTERSGWRTAYMVWEEKRRSWCPELEKKKKKRNSVDAKKSENSSSNDDVLCWGENAQIRRWTLYRERERACTPERFERLLAWYANIANFRLWRKHHWHAAALTKHVHGCLLAKPVNQLPALVGPCSLFLSRSFSFLEEKRTVERAIPYKR